MAKLAAAKYPLEVTFGRGVDIDQVIAYERKVWGELSERSADLPPDQVVGGFISFPVADGKAAYLVTKESPLTLQHVPLGDGYQIDPAHIRGLRKADVLAMMRQERAWTAHFRRCKEVSRG